MPVNEAFIYNKIIKLQVIQPLFCSSSRIICTDSKRQVAHSNQFQSIDNRPPHHVALSCPVTFLKDIAKVPDNQYLKLINLPGEYHGIETFLKTEGFSSALPRSLFFYDVNLAGNSKNPLPISSVYFYSFEDIYNSSIYHAKSRQVSTGVDEVFFAGSSDAKGNDTGRPTEEQLLHVIDKLTRIVSINVIFGNRIILIELTLKSSVVVAKLIRIDLITRITYLV